MRNSYQKIADNSLEEVFQTIESHILSLPVEEAEDRLEKMDKAHGRARISEVRKPPRASRKHPSLSYTRGSSDLCRNHQ